MRTAALLALFGWVASFPAFAEPPRTQLSHEEANALIASLLVASPYKLGEAARNGHIRYRLTFANSYAHSVPQTGEQRAVEQDGVVVVDICAECGKEATPSDADLQRYRSASAWVESNDRDIRAFARRHGSGRNIAQRMTALSAAVRAHMNGSIDFRRYDSAATAFKSRSGDCTEAALLLAAAARAREIPARVVYGIAYSSRFTGKTHVFSPHSWVQAWDGQHWRSYDAGLGHFDAGHIALAIGDGSAAELAPAMHAIPGMRIVDAYGVLPAE